MKKSPSLSTSITQLLLWGTGGVTLIGLLTVLSIWRTSDRALNLITNLFKPQPVEPKLEHFTPIIQGIQNIQELATTVQTVETMVPTSADRKLGDVTLGTTKLLYLARGEIRAGIDLAELTAADISINQDQIEINLPPAKILDSKIDVNHSQVYHYDRGWFNLGPDVAPQLQTLAQRKTLVEITNTACQAGILDTANQKATEAIADLLTVQGYQKFAINSTPSTACNATTDSEDSELKL
ncbi:MAG: DUF4230 domain-containing protein [Cyanobacteria bacterium J06621_8]